MRRGAAIRKRRVCGCAARLAHERQRYQVLERRVDTLLEDNERLRRVLAEDRRERHDEANRRSRGRL